MQKIYGVIFLFLSLSFTHFSFGQTAGKQVPVKAPTSKKSPNALLYLPWDYNTSKKDYPLLCFYHGSGEAGTDLNKLRKQGLPYVIDKGAAPYTVNKNTGDTTWFIVLSIQAPSSNSIKSPSSEVMLAGISTLIKDYHIRIDKNRIYPTGLSAGGRQSLWSIMEHPDKFPAAIVMSPSGSMHKDKLKNLSNSFVWFFQGIKDHNVNPYTAYNSNAWINSQYPGHSDLTKYDGAHGGWINFYDPAWRNGNGLSIYDFLMQYSLDKEVTLPKPNQLPIAHAGAPQTLTLPDNVVTLDGSGSKDPDGAIKSYRWSQKSGPANALIERSEVAKTRVSKLKEGTYIFTLTVTDDRGATAIDELQVIVNSAPNQLPIAHAGAPQTITLPDNVVTLDGSGSKDPDGAIKTHRWSQKSGPAGALIERADAAKTRVSKLKEGTYIFTLTVTDNRGGTHSAEIQVKVNKKNSKGTIQNPIADAGKNITVFMPENRITLDGTGTIDKNEGGGYIFYKWAKIGGPSQGDIKFPSKSITSFKNLAVGTYLIKLTVRINSGPSVSDTLKVIVKADPVKPGSVPYTANTKVNPYTEDFQYGTNPSSYGNGWDDTSIAHIALKAGVHSLRLPLPDYFVGHYGYKARLKEFNHYTHQLGMKAITLFVERPRKEFEEPHTHVFKNLYEPIWDDGANGTPVNENNYFASYIYKLVKLYGNNIKFWEIVNEPDITGFWDNANKNRSNNWWDNPPQPSALPNLKAPIYSYIRMLRIAYEVIKKLDPDAYVAPGGLGYPAFLDAILRYTDNPDGGKVSSQYPLKGGAYFDVLSYHVYPAYQFKEWDNSIGGFKWNRHSDRAADVVIDLKNQFKKVLTDRGYDGKKYPKKLFILTETNLASKSFGDYYGSKEIQRNFIMKALVKAQQNNIKQYYTFVIGDFDNYNAAKNGNDVMGLYENLKRDKYGQEKLTEEGKAFKTTSELLYGWRYDGAQTKALSLPDSIAGAAFKRGEEYRYVLWAKTQTDKSEKAYAAYSFPASFKIDSLYSYEWNYSVNPDVKKEIRSENIQLTGAPLFFTVKSKIKDPYQTPEVNAGQNKTITLPVNFVTLNGSASVNKGEKIVSYHWEQLSGPSAAKIETKDRATTKVNSLATGVYVFSLTVKDTKGGQAKDKVTINVKPNANVRAIANAGPDRTVTLPKDTIILNGSVTQGTVTDWQWTKTSGPAGGQIQQTGSKAVISNLHPGTYTFFLTVKGTVSWPSSDKVTIKVKEDKGSQEPPKESETGSSNDAQGGNDNKPKRAIANAGSDRIITLPKDTIILDGYQTTGTVTKWYWSKQKGPKGGDIALKGSKAIISNLHPGVYHFYLTVSGPVSWPSSDRVVVTVKAHAAFSRKSITVTNDNASDTSFSNNNATNTHLLETIFADPFKKWNKALPDIGIKIYPNPVHNQLNMEVHKAFKGKVSYRIIDISGKIIQESNLGEQPKQFKKSIYLTDLNKGIYFLQIIKDQRISITKKIIKL